MNFVWDPVKAQSNERRHGVSFADASTAFRDPYAIYEVDPHHPERGVLIGTSMAQHLLFVVHIEVLSDDTIRIISARKVDRKERCRYEEG